MVVRGIDVSEWQGVIDWPHVKRDGIQFAAIRATQGIYHKDTQLPHNWQKTAHGTVIRGAYHYLDPRDSGEAQADYLHEYVRDNGHFVPGDYVMLDLEDDFGLSGTEVLMCAEAFVTRAREQIHKQVVLYTYPYFWYRIAGRYRGLLNTCPLHLADYQQTMPGPLPGWSVLSFWQYTDMGYVNGVPGNVDCDLFNGDYIELKKVVANP